MRVSLNQIRQFINFDLPPTDELVARINAQLGGVEEVIDLASKYKDAKIIRVVECEKHPNADKLSSCKIDAGTGELIQVVCGAPNVHADMWAVWLPPESIVPSTYGTADEFTLGARELRGIVSNGMLASARELGIGDDHDGIVELTESDLPEGAELAVGASFGQVFGLNDTIIDIENKMFTHRPDLFGQLGVAREIAGILGKQFTSPLWYSTTPEFQNGEGLPLELFNDAPDKAPRLTAVAIKKVAIKPSPMWLKCALVAMGGKPINNIVDATNYIMLITAQPTHAYDYDKIRGHKLGVRMARDGEKLPLLNGKTYELTVEDVVIADGEGAIGLAGIMGGGNSEVSADTKNIVLEVANFDMYTVRKTSMRYGIFTDALTRFNKGQSPLQNAIVLARLMELIEGEQASVVLDTGEVDGREAVQITSEFINERLGLQLQNNVIKTILENVEVAVDSPDDHDTYLSVWPPFWRTDLELPEDIVEEVGRLYGYDRLPHELPLRSTRPTPVNEGRALAQKMRAALARSGANEVLTYSFVHERILQSASQDVTNAYQLSNALSPDLQYYRLSLTPSLLDRVHANAKAGYGEFGLFEIGKSHTKQSGFDDDGLPLEASAVAFVYASKEPRQGAPFYAAKAFLEFLTTQLGLEVTYEQLGAQSSSAIVAPFEPKHTAIILDKNTGTPLGVMGEYKKSVCRSFKLPDYTAGFELDRQALLLATKEVGQSYTPLSRYPSVDRDISLKVASDVSYEQTFQSLVDALAATQLQTQLSPLGIYRPDGADTKNITFRIVLTAENRTLTSDEVNAIVEDVAGRLSAAIGAEII